MKELYLKSFWKRVKVEIEEKGDYRYIVRLEGREYDVEAVPTEENLYSVKLNGSCWEVHGERSVDYDGYDILVYGDLYKIMVESPYSDMERSKARIRGSSIAEIVTSMPGKIVRILVNEGDEVKEGDGLIIVEAMKMENEFKADEGGIVQKILVKEGESVEAGAKLILIDSGGSRGEEDEKDDLLSRW